MNHKHTCYHLGIDALAKACSVSRSSILRLAQKLGFSGYSEFRVFLKWEDQPEEGESMSFEKLLDDIEANLKFLRTKDMTDMCQLIDELTAFSSTVLEMRKRYAPATCKECLFRAIAILF